MGIVANRYTRTRALMTAEPDECVRADPNHLIVFDILPIRFNRVNGIFLK